MQANP
jgi:hypothetical protein